MSSNYILNVRDRSDHCIRLHTSVSLARIPPNVKAELQNCVSLKENTCRSMFKYFIATMEKHFARSETVSLVK